MKRIYFLLFVVVLLPVSVNLSASDGKLFPDIPGWKKNVIDRVYTSDDLWELINGAADIFLSYYFEDLNMAEYERGDEMIRVELYRHNTGDDAYGIYSAERMPDYPQVTMGAQGYRSQGVMNFFCGKYYVKIMSAGVKETDEETISMIAEKVNATLNQPDAMPETLRLFPEEGKIDLSDSYIAQNFLGYSFLHHAFIMKYDKPSAFQMFLIKLPGQTDQMAERYIQMVKPENVTENNGLLILKDPFNGTVFLKKHKGYLIGVINTDHSETAEAVINQTIEKIN